MPPPPFGDLKAHSEMNFLCAKVLAYGQNASTAGAVPLCGSLYQSALISLLLLYKSKPLCWVSICFSASFFFGLRRLMPPPPYGDSKCSAEMNSPCAKVLADMAKTLLRQAPSRPAGPKSRAFHFAAPPFYKSKPLCRGSICFSASFFFRPPAANAASALWRFKSP